MHLARRVLTALVAGTLLLATFVAFANRVRASGFVPTVPSGFTVTVVARVPGARELAFAPNGDLFVGTPGAAVALVPDADGSAGAPVTFVRLPDPPAAGVAFAGDALYVGTHTGVYRVAYGTGDRRASSAPVKLASVRTSVTGGHATTSVAVSGDTLYVGVGSSCNACVETDPTRASVQTLRLPNGDLHPKALRMRNPIALARDANGAVWAGVAGQDELEHGHPYEIFDDVSRGGTLDYGWPVCFENRRRADAGADCSAVTVPRVVFPAYETPIGAAFYPLHATGRYAFPPAYAGGAFVALHGSWHLPPVAPRVAFVAMRDGSPAVPVDWNDPGKQWSEFAGGFQNLTSRNGRPTGVAVGPQGSLFVADDEAGAIYRIRFER